MSAAAETGNLAWPFFDDGHRAYARDCAQWTVQSLPPLLEGAEAGLHEVYACVRRLVGELGRAGLLRVCAPMAYGGLREQLDVRGLSLARETLARASGLADSALAIQGLGSAPVNLFGTHSQKLAVLPGAAEGHTVAAFALSEPDAGSDLAAICTTVSRMEGGWRLDGVKTWISNAGLADSYVIFARSGEAPGSRGLSVFIAHARMSGLDASERIDVIAPHPLETPRLNDCRVGDHRMLGEPGQGSRSRWARKTRSASRHFWGRSAGDGTARARRSAGACAQPPALRPKAGRIPAHTNEARRNGAFDWRLGTVGLPSRVDQGCAAHARHSRGLNGQALLHRIGATAYRHRGAAVRRHGGGAWRAQRIYEGASDVPKLIVGASTLQVAHAPLGSHGN